MDRISTDIEIPLGKERSSKVKAQKDICDLFAEVVHNSILMGCLIAALLQAVHQAETYLECCESFKHNRFVMRILILCSFRQKVFNSIEKLPDLTWSSLSLVFLGDSVLLTNVDLDKRLHISWQGLIAAEIVQHC